MLTYLPRKIRRRAARPEKHSKNAGVPNKENTVFSLALIRLSRSLSSNLFLPDKSLICPSFSLNACENWGYVQ